MRIIRYSGLKLHKTGEYQVLGYSGNPPCRLPLPLQLPFSAVICFSFRPDIRYLDGPFEICILPPGPQNLKRPNAHRYLSSPDHSAWVFVWTAKHPSLVRPRAVTVNPRWYTRESCPVCSSPHSTSKCDNRLHPVPNPKSRPSNSRLFPLLSALHNVEYRPRFTGSLMLKLSLAVT